MKVVHLILSCFYKEGYGYQENILPSIHKKMGHKTSILTRYYESNIFPSHEKSSNIYTYSNSSGVDVYILPENNNILTKVPLFSRLIHHTKGLYKLLDSLSPDVIFCHGIFISDYDIIIKYKDTHNNVKIYIAIFFIVCK